MSIIFLSGTTYILFAVPSLIKVLIKIIKKEYDELERKVVFDSLGLSMLIVTLVNLIQFILACYHSITGLYKYIPIISPGMPFNNALSNFNYYPYAHMESIFFNLIIISIIYNINRYRYGLLSKEKTFKPIKIILSIFIPLGILSFVATTFF